jgi:cation diffusion facilitator family transporter
MADLSADSPIGHSHVFLGEGHEANERRTWLVIGLCGLMMAAEITGGLLFGSIALVADGLHMSTHAGALLLAAVAYSYARRHAHDPRFSFGTGKLGDLAGFTSAIVLAMIAILIAYQAVARLLHPITISFGEAIPIAVVGLGVNVASVWLLSAGGHHHHHGHGHGHDHHDHEDESHAITTREGTLTLSVFEDGVPPRFRVEGHAAAGAVTIETVRDDGARQVFAFADRGDYLESIDEIPEPHAFKARLTLAGETHEVVFEEHDHDHGSAHTDNNMRAAIVHVFADAAVSVLVIAGLILARLFGWVWMDPIAGLIGAAVIASWSYGLIRDTGAILLDMAPAGGLAATLRGRVEAQGDEVSDLHVWRLGPGHLGAIVAIRTKQGWGSEEYRARLSGVRNLSHLTIEVTQAP